MIPFQGNMCITHSDAALHFVKRLEWFFLGGFWPYIHVDIDYYLLLLLLLLLSRPSYDTTWEEAVRGCTIKGYNFFSINIV